MIVTDGSVGHSGQRAGHIQHFLHFGRSFF